MTRTIGPAVLERHRVALVLDPRFPGGTSAAVAAEVRALAPIVDLRIIGLETAMFRGRTVAPVLEDTLEDLGLAIDWMPPVVRADTIVIHNPSCLRHDRAFSLRLSAARAFLVTHENFLRPNGAESHDVAACLALFAQALVCGTRQLAPISPVNRRSVTDWLARHGADWSVAPLDWFNIFDQPLLPPTAQPRDRRGRHSRPGAEKFPPLDALLGQFPPSSEAAILLGADGLRAAGDPPPHWDLRPFDPRAVARFLADIDIFVYFTHPLFQESFGRVIAEATAAGKLVITDPRIAETFGPGLLTCDGSGPAVDALVARHIADPQAYAAAVHKAQAGLAAFGPARFRDRLAALLAASREVCDVVV